MKNFRFIALATLICMAMQIQVAQADELSKEEKKAIQEQLDSIMYNEAVKAVNDTMFTLEASRATFKTGYTINVTSSTNFITVKKSKASIQTAFNASISGANGMGGVTVDGTISNYRISTDKKSGDTMVSMSVWRHYGLDVGPWRRNIGYCEYPHFQKRQQGYRRNYAQLQFQQSQAVRHSVAIGKEYRVQRAELVSARIKPV